MCASALILKLLRQRVALIRTLPPLPLLLPLLLRHRLRRRPLRPRCASRLCALDLLRRPLGLLPRPVLPSHRRRRLPDLRSLRLLRTSFRPRCRRLLGIATLEFQNLDPRAWGQRTRQYDGEGSHRMAP